MKEKIIFLLAHFLGVFACYSNAQSVDELKKQVNTIKKSSDYIYGQAAGEDETVTYKIAYETFLQKVKMCLLSAAVIQAIANNKQQGQKDFFRKIH